MTPAAIIKARLAELGWTAADLARATAVPPSNLSAILAGNRPLLAKHLFVIDSVLTLGLDLNQFEKKEAGDGA